MTAVFIDQKRNQTYYNLTNEERQALAAIVQNAFDKMLDMSDAELIAIDINQHDVEILNQLRKYINPIYMGGDQLDPTTGQIDKLNRALVKLDEECVEYEVTDETSNQEMRNLQDKRRLAIEMQRKKRLQDHHQVKEEAETKAARNQEIIDKLSATGLFNF